MKVIDLYETLRAAAQQNPLLPVVARGVDDMGNEVEIRLKGIVALGTDQWGHVLVLK